MAAVRKLEKLKQERLAIYQSSMIFSGLALQKTTISAVKSCGKKAIKLGRRSRMLQQNQHHL